MSLFYLYFKGNPGSKVQSFANEFCDEIKKKSIGIGLVDFLLESSVSASFWPAFILFCPVPFETPGPLFLVH